MNGIRSLLFKTNDSEANTPSTFWTRLSALGRMLSGLSSSPDLALAVRGQKKNGGGGRGEGKGEEETRSRKIRLRGPHVNCACPKSDMLLHVYSIL